MPQYGTLEGLKHILSYLHGTIHLYECDFDIVGYTRAEFQADPDNRAPTLVSFFTLYGGVLSWCNIKQKCDVEYVSALEATKDIIQLRNFVLELGIVPSMENPNILCCDYSGVVAECEEPWSHKDMKHVEKNIMSSYTFLLDGRS